MARNYAAEYAARNERAIERGFSDYTSERHFKENFSEKLSYARDEFGYGPNETYNPREALSDYYEAVQNITGLERHDMVLYFMDEGMTEAEAVAAMREIMGDS